MDRHYPVDSLAGVEPSARTVAGGGENLEPSSEARESAARDVPGTAAPTGGL